MTIGIYSLYWKIPDLVYIGQSVEIETRFIRHLWEMKNGSHSNNKVQRAYNKYGSPELVILEKCLTNQLNELEIVYTYEFDSIKSGLNIIEAGGQASGINAANSKYSKFQILKIFILLYKTSLSGKEISNRVKVPEHVVSDIMCGRSHYWLQERYPEKFAMISEMTKERCSRRIRGIIKEEKYKGTLLSPFGVRYEIVSIRQFVENNLILFGSTDVKVVCQGVRRVLTKMRGQYKGWTLLDV